MAIAKKCDRCGNFYTWNGHDGVIHLNHTENAPYEFSKDVLIRRFDLCADCMRKVEKLIFEFRHDDYEAYILDVQDHIDRVNRVPKL